MLLPTGLVATLLAQLTGGTARAPVSHRPGQPTNSVRDNWRGFVTLSGATICRSHPCHHDHGERDLEAEIHDPERMRLIIQIIVVFEILISCIRRSTAICFMEWANQPSRTPNGTLLREGRKGSSSWLRVCRTSRPHGLMGGRIQQRAERNAG